MDALHCPVTLTTRIIGGKWKPSILFHLEGRVRRFNELRRLLAVPTKKMLTQQLRELERDGLVNRKVYAEVPPRVEYALTPKGRALVPLIEDMRAYGREWLGVCDEDDEAEADEAPQAADRPESEGQDAEPTDAESSAGEEQV